MIRVMAAALGVCSAGSGFYLVFLILDITQNTYYNIKYKEGMT